MLFLNEEKLNLAKVKKEFFPYFHVENALSQELDSLDLINDFPDIESGGSFPSDDLAEGFIKQLVQELEGSEFKSILENKLDTLYSSSNIESKSISFCIILSCSK